MHDADTWRKLVRNEAWIENIIYQQYKVLCGRKMVELLCHNKCPNNLHVYSTCRTYDQIASNLYMIDMLTFFQTLKKICNSQYKSQKWSMPAEHKIKVHNFSQKVQPCENYDN